MLNQFTWQEFIAAVLMAGIAYYAIATMILYHQEIIAFFKAKSDQSGKPTMQPAPATTTVALESAPPFQAEPAPVGASVHTAAKEDVEEPVESEGEVVSDTPEPGYSGEQLPDERQAPLELVIDDEGDATTAEDTTLIIGVVSDLLSEMKSLFVVCAENKTPRLEVLRFIRLLLQRYTSLYHSQYKESITLYTYHAWNEHLSQPVDLTELTYCWLPNQPQ